jgi:thiol-disulfide isomerase/thioredoxin
MTMLVAVAVLGFTAVAGRADDAKPAKPDKPAPALKVGDPAPPLKASKWLQGDEVRAFEPGKVYVVEFWATWCGPCIAFMPSLAELQAEYKDKGVACIGYTARDPDNTADKAAAFVKKRGPKLAYTFAYSDDRTSYDAWMTAAGRTAIPCAFVVDKTGRVAYHGNPMYLPVVLPKVVAGNLSAKEVSAAADKVRQEYSEASAALFPDHAVGLKKLKEFEAKYPPLANNLIIVRAKLSLLPKVGDVPEAKAVAEAVMAKAVAQENPSSLLQVSALLRNGPGKEHKELLAVAVKAAEAAVRLTGEKDAGALLDLAESHLAVGDKAKAQDSARKAVAAASEEPAALRQAIEQAAAKMMDGK